MEAINRRLLLQKADTLTEPEIAEVLEYIEVMESLSSQTSTPDPLDEMLLRILTAALRVEPRSSRSPYGQRSRVIN